MWSFAYRQSQRQLLPLPEKKIKKLPRQWWLWSLIASSSFGLPRVDEQTRLKTRHLFPPWYYHCIINRKHLRDSDDRLVKSTSPLKPPRGTKHSDRLVHDPFADAKIFVNPLLDFSVFGYTVRVQARSVKDPAVAAERRTSQFVCLILVLYHCRSKRDVRGEISRGWTSMHAAYRASKHLRITDECKRERDRKAGRQ